MNEEEFLRLKEGDVVVMINVFGENNGLLTKVLSMDILDNCVRCSSGKIHYTRLGLLSTIISEE